MTLSFNNEKLLEELDKLRKIISGYNISFLMGAGASYFKKTKKTKRSLNNYVGFPIMTDFTLVFSNGLKEYQCIEIKEKVGENDCVSFDGNKIKEIRNIEQFFDLVYKKGVSEEICENLKELFNKTLSKELNWYKEQKQVYDFYIEFYKYILKILEKYSVNNFSKIPITVATLNYDLFNEIVMEKLSIIYNDGFLGTYNPIFDVNNYKIVYKINDRIMPRINFFKLHGSIGWIDGSDGEIIKSFGLENEKKAMILPSNEKYFEVFKDYAFSISHFFSSSLSEGKNILFIFGTSLGDKHICNILNNMYKINKSLRIFVLWYGDIEHNLSDGNLDDRVINVTNMKENNIIWILKKLCESKYLEEKG